MTVQPEDHGFVSDRLDQMAGPGRAYVDRGEMPFAMTQVAHRGEVVFADVYGKADVVRDVAATPDTIVRIYSMTKPITSVALMQLYERGALLLEDPVAKFIPAFADTQVWNGGTQQSPATRAPSRPMTIKDLLTHTAGLTYGFRWQHPLDGIYRDKGLGNLALPGVTLEEMCTQLAALPLLHDPGAKFNYSMATDVVGRVVEVASGQPLDRYVEANITGPLGMVDTGFHVRDGQGDRLAALYIRGRNGLSEVDNPSTSAYQQPPSMFSGGGGMVSTLGDYQRFLNMLVGGGETEGVRILGGRTLRYMALNHLPEGRSMNQMNQTIFEPDHMAGLGFGLGFAVITDPASHSAVSSPGEFSWGGMASTFMWVDPVHEVTALFLTQLMPSSQYPIRRELRAAISQAML